jgi:hypothetical protein
MGRVSMAAIEDGLMTSGMLAVLTTGHARRVETTRPAPPDSHRQEQQMQGYSRRVSPLVVAALVLGTQLIAVNAVGAQNFSHLIDLNRSVNKTSGLDGASVFNQLDLSYSQSGASPTGNYRGRESGSVSAKGLKASAFAFAGSPSPGGYIASRAIVDFNDYIGVTGPTRSKLHVRVRTNLTGTFKGGGSGTGRLESQLGITALLAKNTLAATRQESYSTTFTTDANVSLRQFTVAKMFGVGNALAGQFLLFGHLRTDANVGKDSFGFPIEGSADTNFGNTYEIEGIDFFDGDCVEGAFDAGADFGSNCVDVTNEYSITSESGFEYTVGTGGVTPPTTTAPEPSTYAMMGAGLLALALMRRRRAEA